MIRIKESKVNLKSGPTQETIHTIRRSFKLVRQDKKRARVFASTAILMTILAVASVVAALVAFQALYKERSARVQLESRLASRRITPDQRECLRAELHPGDVSVALGKE